MTNASLFKKLLRWVRAGILVVISLGLVISAGIYGYFLYKNRPIKQTMYYGIKLGMDKNQVMSIAGLPQYVKVHTTYPNLGVVYHFVKSDKIPSGESVMNYSRWGYNPHTFVRFDSKTGKVVMVSCIDFYSYGDLCNPILGIGTRTPEAYVLNRLGKPDKEVIKGISKTMFYKKLNIELVLDHKGVFMLAVSNDIASNLH